MIERYISATSLECIYGGNSFAVYLDAVLLFVISLAVMHVVQRVLLRRAQIKAAQTATKIDDVAFAVIGRVRPPFYFYFALWLGLRTLALPALVASVINAMLVVLVVYQVIVSVQIIIDHFTKRGESGGDQSSASMALLAAKVAKIALWAIGGVLVLANLGVDVTSLVAGLGIGGIAVALALQNIFGDLFGAFVIYFDKPFVIGDFVVIGDKMGTVEKIGIKTTRLRALSGEEITMGNKEITNTTIQNYRRMQRRRVTLEFGVTYDVAQKKLEDIPRMVEHVINAEAEATFDRVHLNHFGESALRFEVVYHVESGDYRAYMDSKQRVLLGIRAVLQKEGIAFAYPTTTVRLEKE